MIGWLLLGEKRLEDLVSLRNTSACCILLLESHLGVKPQECDTEKSKFPVCVCSRKPEAEREIHLDHHCFWAK